MKKEIQKIISAQISSYHEPSIKLMECIKNLAITKNHVAAKIEYKKIVQGLIINGEPDFKNIIKYLKISELIAEYGESDIQKVLFLIIKNFCDGFNIIRNMTEDQMIDLAYDLTIDCGNYRMEDYVLFFENAKNGKYGKILDHIDSYVILNMLSYYDEERYKAGEFIQELQIRDFDSMGKTGRSYVPVSENEIKIFGQPNAVKSVLSDIKSEIKRQLDSRK